MKLYFSKMHGAGNDFVIIDQVTQEIKFNPEWVDLISSRKFGVGCDQVLLLEPPKHKDTDFYYRIFNADGTEVEQCGNGARCIGQFIVNKQLSPKASWELETITSRMTVALAPNNQGIRVNIGVPDFNAKNLPFNFTEQNIVNNNIFKITIEDTEHLYYLKHNMLEFSLVSVGNPHIVINLDNIDIDYANKNLITNFINKIGSYINSHPQFPKGVNVNFIKIKDQRTIELTTYERGVGITLACGSGSCAAAVCAKKLGWITDNVITVENAGGILKVTWNDADESPIWLTGPTTTVFEGYINL
jgi:diaminopimelate epimerase